MSSSSSTVPSIATASSRASLPYIPDELLLNCLARVPRFYYPTLSIVSKRFRSLVASEEIYETRKFLGCTESCLYVCLRCFHEINLRWLTLWRKPTRIPNPNPNPNPKPTLVSIPSHDYFPKYGWDLIAVGSNIYIIGGCNANEPSSRVFIMDCRFHKWREAPSIKVARNFPSPSVFDGKIYVAGGCKDSDPSNLIECFYPKTQKWEHVQIPDAYKPGNYILKSLAIQGNLYLFGNHKNVVYKPKEDKWDAMGSEMLRYDRIFYSICVIDNILYCYGMSGKLQWYDFEERSWRVLKGLEKLSKLPDCYSGKLVNSGGKIAVLWEDGVDAICFKKIWCAEIALKRRNKQEIYGNVEWCDVVLTAVPKSWNVRNFIAVTI